MYLILLLGILIGIPGCFIMSYLTIISSSWLLNAALVITIIGSLVILLSARYRKNIVSYITCLFGVAPLCILLFLLINWLPLNSAQRISTHDISAFSKAGYEDVIVEYSDSAFKDMQRLRTFDLAEISLKNPSQAVYTSRKGNLGYDVLISKRIE